MKKRMKLKLQYLSLICLALFSLGPQSGCKPPKENVRGIVFILVDDMPYAGMSLTGNPILETPNMDRIASEGIFFTRAYSEILCYPSRATIMTGQYAARHGRTDVAPGVHPHALMREPDLPDPVGPGTYTLVKALKAGGYRTALSGKWHIPRQHLTPAMARDHGFDFCHKTADRGNPYRDTENFTNEAIRFLKENKDHKFFLYLPYVAVHGPHIVPAEDQQRWKEILKGKDTGFLPDMLAGLEFVDHSVGRVLDALEELGLEENTLVVLASDNGGLTSEMYSDENRPFRRGKGTLYEGGIRVPLVMRWPGHIEPGSRSDVPVHFADLFPTFCDVAGVAVDPGHTLDGVSLEPVFSGGSLPERCLFFHYPHYICKWGTTPVRSVVQERYKLVWYPYDHVSVEGPILRPRTLSYSTEPCIEFFDLSGDPGERDNIAGKHPDKVKEMQALMEAWLEDTGALMNEANPDFDPNRPMLNSRDERIRREREKNRVK
jgi:uncharacterized sulfatase